jgi:hypothetical protein
MAGSMITLLRRLATNERVQALAMTAARQVLEQAKPHVIDAGKRVATAARAVPPHRDPKGFGKRLRAEFQKSEPPKEEG